MPGWNNYKAKDRVANIVSTLSNAPLIALFMFLGLNYYFLNGADFIMVTLVSVCFAVVIPSMIAYAWIRNKKLELDMPNKEDRLYPLFWILLSYLLGVIVLFTISAPPVITVLMILLLLHYSGGPAYQHVLEDQHALCGDCRPVAFLIYVFGYPGLISILLIPLVMWSRLYLKRHTRNQVIAGASLGFALTTVQIYFLIGF